MDRFHVERVAKHEGNTLASAEIMSGRSSSQQGLTATCIDLMVEGTPEA
jgi:hypothetical protein